MITTYSHTFIGLKKNQRLKKKKKAQEMKMIHGAAHRHQNRSDLEGAPKPKSLGGKEVNYVSQGEGGGLGKKVNYILKDWY